MSTEYGNLFVSPKNFYSIVPELYKTDTDYIKLPSEIVAKFIGRIYKTRLNKIYIGELYNYSTSN